MGLLGPFEIFLAISCFVIICFFVNEKGFPLKRRKDRLPRNWPVVGMIPALIFEVHRLHDWVTLGLNKLRYTIEFKGPLFSKMDILITSDLANVNYIMTTNFSNFSKGPQYKEMFDVLGDGIFNSDFDSWKEQRRLAQVMLGHHLFRKFLVKSTQDKVHKGLVPLIMQVTDKDLVVDLQDLFRRFTFDATWLIVTGNDPGCLAIDFPEVDLARSMDDAAEAVFYRHIIPVSIWKLQRWLNIGKEKKLNMARKIFDRAAAELIVSKKKEHREIKNAEEPKKGIDLLAAYMRDNGHYDEKFLRDTILTFLFAGRDATSSAMSWFFFLLSTKPEAEERIREELEEVASQTVPQCPRLFDMDQVKGLTYLHGALCETMRLYPPIPIEQKAPLKQDTLPSGHQVDQKNKIFISLYAMGRNASIWGEDCLEFKPERWITDRGGIKHEPSYKFMAFNAGPRICLGKEVAFTQMKMVAANILYNYIVHVLEGQSVTPCLSVVLPMKQGMKVRITKRWTSP